MTIAQEFSEALRASDDLMARLAQAGVPQHCACAAREFHARIEALSLSVARLQAELKAAATETA